MELNLLVNIYYRFLEAHEHSGDTVLDLENRISNLLKDAERVENQLYKDIHALADTEPFKSCKEGGVVTTIRNVRRLIMTYIDPENKIRKTLKKKVEEEGEGEEPGEFTENFENAALTRLSTAIALTLYHGKLYYGPGAFRGGKRRSMKKNKKTQRRKKKRHSRTQMRKRKSMSFW